MHRFVVGITLRQRTPTAAATAGGFSSKRKSPGQGSGVLPGALPRLVLRSLVAPLSHLSKSETECEVTPPR
jgi:hypothetical protein